MKHIHQLQIFFNYFDFSFNTKHFTLKLGNLSAEFQRGLGWSRPILSLMSKYCLMILLITLTYVTLSDL